MPEDLLDIGTAYFMLETLQLVCVFINTIYFAVEKSRGNTKRIMYLNFLVLFVKFSLTILFIFGFKGGLMMLSFATLLAQATLTVIALVRLTSRNNPFRLSLKAVDPGSATLKPILSLAIPVFLEKFAFSFGKVTVNSMSAAYGSTVIGALGISNRLGGICTMPPIGVQEAESTLISQNLGNGNLKRAIGIFNRAFILNLGIGIVFYALMWVCMEPVIHFFAKGDPAFAAEIRKIYVYERDATIILSGASAAMGLLYGFGWTRVSMVMNILRLFAYRIPPLWYIQHYTRMGSEGVGFAMLISNVLFSLTAIVTAFYLVLRVKRKQSAATEM
jgi:Na+-driven multidrug efflux pump